MQTHGSHDHLLIIKPVNKIATHMHSSSGDSSGDGKRAKCQIAYATFKKWQKQFNIDYQSFS